ncbi:FluC/FEX family fluoride channel [Aspergillus homomorphus CBS 101889]|uniref:Putative chromosome condensation protein n=1 Tax=Aspergillus homomorphus (strain CBS 101889) TaxID=1450537 RepID=A0A395I638_ASPHC|nr:putative chromosome condensation protein [Aspergillus homomorphus CBS 101889]RAL14913.1 putative chromosome condensation protein [Aspergillus homomorphus CBS 101889]
MTVPDPENHALTDISAPPPTTEYASQRQSWSLEEGSSRAPHAHEKPPEEPYAPPPSAPTSQRRKALYTHSYLVFFSIFGTLARLGLQSLTDYPGAPISTSVLWANVAGTLIMGFLLEDQTFFTRHRPENHKAVKKTIPLYIGLTTGFCGSFTSFSSFIRDTFLALTNSLPSPYLTAGTPTPSRNGGYSFMAVLAVIISTVALSISALLFGSHLALLANQTPSLFRFTAVRIPLDPIFILLGWGAWLGAILLAIFPPHDHWRSDAVFAIVFAPLGCLLRYHLSLWLNARLPRFPLGTFTVNMLGTIVLAMCFDLQRVEGVGAAAATTATVSAGIRVSCQVLQGVMDGFCGAATTISTWVAELNGLARRRDAYLYGVVSVAVALGFFVVIAGSLAWTRGFVDPVCT